MRHSMLRMQLLNLLLALPLSRRLPSLLLLLVLLGLGSPTAAEWVAYGPSDRAARQDLELPGCRAALDLTEPFGPDDSNEFTASGQAEALNCELESWRRTPGMIAPPDVALHEAAINAHLQRLMDRLSLGVATGKCDSVSPQVPSGCFGNVVIARRAGYLTAYILNRYTERSWEAETLDSARALYRNVNWWQGLGNGGNSFVPLIGMRLLGGEALGDPVLESRGIAELHYVHGLDLRRGIPEPMARCYAGIAIGQLELLRETNDPELRDMVEDMLAVQLLVNAHNYLPGGEVGGPQDRKHGPLAVLDASGVGDCLLHHLNMVISDPDMPPEVGHVRYTLASDYTAPAAIQSIFLDKAGGYSFWYRATAPNSPMGGSGYEGERHYPSYGWQGFDGLIATNYESSPWQTVTLPNGAAQMGIMYAAGGDTGFSNGLFARDDSDTFSVYYHHQPRPSKDSKTSWDPLTDDPDWRYEAHTPYRRMMHGRTAITLFEPHDEHPFLLYTIAHLPGAVGVDITECPWIAYPQGNEWLVRRHAGAWVAYLPLGAHTRETKYEGNWTFLQFENDIISGNITEMAEGSAYADASAYCRDLAGRNVHFDPLAANVQLEVRPPGGSEVTIMLDYFADQRSIDSGAGFVVQPDDGFVDKGFMHVAPVQEPSWLKWTGEFRLEVDRAPHPVVTLDFGDPTLPSPPQTVSVKNEAEVNTAPIELSWDHGVDDNGIVEYKIWRDGVEIASVFADDPGDPFGADLGRKGRFTDPREPINGGVPTLVQYRVESVDIDGNHSLVKSMIKEVTVQAAPPTAPVLMSTLGGVENVTLEWTPSTDNWGISGYEVLRDGTSLANLSGTAESYVDTTVLPNESYDYTIRAYDPAGLSTDSAPMTGMALDDLPPSAPPNFRGRTWGTTTVLWWGSASDEWGISAYQVLRDGVPLRITSRRYLFTRNVPSGTYTYTVRAIDLGANYGPESQPLVLTVR